MYLHGYVNVCAPICDCDGATGFKVFDFDVFKVHKGQCQNIQIIVYSVWRNIYSGVGKGQVNPLKALMKLTGIKLHIRR